MGFDLMRADAVGREAVVESDKRGRCEKKAYRC